ncbi:MAG: hypothetical protein WCS01_16550, partial [bacterium]
KGRSLDRPSSDPELNQAYLRSPTNPSPMPNRAKVEGSGATEIWRNSQIFYTKRMPNVAIAPYL